MESRARSRIPIQSLSLISLLDIFTILLLFLLVQSGNPDEALPVIESLHLPYSQSQAPPRRDLVIAIDREHVLLEGRPVVRVEEVQATEGALVPALAEALRSYLEAAALERTGNQKLEGRVTIMGDRDTPFSVLKKVMYTCSAQHFGHISLAVQQRDEAAP